ncbi:MAG: patatin-like phospholipase family protein [Lachnospiraceae bacterium]|nr:patatin-like phospholipase family protein [Lachnospiraceae bacterium]
MTNIDDMLNKIDKLNTFFEIDDPTVDDVREVYKKEDVLKSVVADIEGISEREVILGNPFAGDKLIPDREIGPDEWGLVLCGGGGRGAYHIGAWKALMEYNNLLSKVTAYSGDSIGAINELLFESVDNATAKQIWLDIDFLTVFDTEPELIDMREGTFSRNEMIDVMRKHINFKKLSESERLMYVNMTRYADNSTSPSGGVPVYTLLNGKDDNLIEHIILASSALPVIYEAVKIGDGYYRDGGLTDNTPVKPLYDAGYRKIIVIGLSTESELDESKYPGCEFVFIKPTAETGNLFTGTLNFSDHQVKFTYELGYRDTLRYLKAHFEKDEAFIKKMDELAAIDFKDIMTDLKIDKYENRFNANMEQLKRFADI